MNSSKIMTTGDVQRTALRLPRPLHEQVLQAAAANNRSMNAEIVARLEGSFRPSESIENIEETLKELTRDQIAVLHELIRHLKPMNIIQRQ